MISPFSVGMAHAPMLGSASHTKLQATFTTAEEIWKASRSELLASGVEPGRIDQFLTWRDAQSIPELVDDLERMDARILTPHDEEYPPLLTTIYDPPAYLFVRGASLLHRTPIAMVGSRHASAYGKDVAERFANALAQAGMSVVSGGAYGIDEASHRGALATNGHTIAVLASGLRGIDNPKHASLFSQILEHGGTIVTEFPPNTPPLKHHFPLRNRIVAGMCKATIVVEAAKASGTMITANAAIRENREVCAIPGNITSITSEGANALIASGAHCVTSPEDIFLLYDMRVAPSATHTRELPQETSTDERALFAVLGAEPLHIDVASERSGLSAQQASAAAMSLELMGIIRDIGGKRFVICAK